MEIKEGASINQHSRDKLDEYIGYYNKLYGTKFSTQTSQLYYNYYNDIAKKVKEKQIDVLLVVNMFLTGFDSKTLNTLYVDKNLKFHGLIQAFSRTNRILNDKKSQGNIVCFRNLKKLTDDAITLFSNKEAKEIILVEPYENYVEKFNKAFSELLNITPTVKSVDSLPSEKEELEFIKSFRELMRVKNVLSSFADFKFDDLSMDEQIFEDYKSKYLDLHDKVKSDHTKEKISILEDVDFELELIHRDDVNVSYILRLLARLKDSGSSQSEKDKQKKGIVDLLNGEATLRSKKELIENFINSNLPQIENSDDVQTEFESYWDVEKQKAFEEMCKEDGLIPDKLEEVIGNYIYTERKPIRDDIIGILEEKPKLLERKKVVERVIEKIMKFVNTFIDGISG